RQDQRHGRAAAPRRVPLEPRDRGAARERPRGPDAGCGELAAPEEVQRQEDRAGGRGRQAPRRERKEGRYRERRLRSRRLPLPRTREGARRERARRRAEVLVGVDVAESRELKERVVEMNRVGKVV